MPPEDFFLWTALSFMTHRAQPLAAISSKKTVELFLLYFLNTIASIWIYVLPQNVWTKKPMLMKEQNRILEEKSKWRTSLSLGIPPTQTPEQVCLLQKQKWQVHSCAKMAVFFNNSEFTSCYSFFFFKQLGGGQSLLYCKISEFHYSLIIITIYLSPEKWGEKEYSRKSWGTSLIVQWLRLCFPMQVVWVQSLVRELRSCIPPNQKVQNMKTEVIL